MDAVRETAMLVTQEEYSKLKALSSEPNVGFWAYLAANPHLLMASGFDEVRIQPSAVGRQLKRLHERTRRLVSGSGKLSRGQVVYRRTFEQHQREEEALCDLILGLHCRETKTGAWFTSDPATRFAYMLPNDDARENFYRTSLDQITTADLRMLTLPGLRLARGSVSVFVSPDAILKDCARIMSSGGLTGALTLPTLWFSPEGHARIEIVESTKKLLLALQANKVTLDAIRWRDLENIVAEILRDRGMEVSITPQSADGGRDVIARGELIPGEPTLLAVEVKHKALVGLDEVRSRLYANRDFPALLFATSGRFTAGVVREKLRPSNHLRLFLKDGAALSQWISAYSASKRRRR